MAGSLTVSTLKNDTGVLATQNGMTGIAKAWVNFNGGGGNTAGIINGSFNVSSITVATTGTYTVNFTTAMPNTTYAPVGTLNYNNVGYLSTLTTVGGTASTTSCVVFGVNSAGGALINPTYVYYAFFNS